MIAMMDTKQRYDPLIAEGERLQELHGALFNEISAILYRVDPVGLNFDVNRDEYDPEAGTILAQLSGASDAEELRRILQDDLVHWFGDDWYGRRKHERLKLLDVAAQEIWFAWQRHLTNQT